MAAMMAYSDDAPEMGSGHGVRGDGMGRWPWEYLFVALNDGLGTFYTPFWMTNLALFIFTIVAYSFGTRRGRGHGTLGDEWEFLLWTGLATFGLNLVYAAFQWYGLFPIITTAVGLFVIGMSGVRGWKFFWLNIVGSLLWATIVTLAGYLFGNLITAALGDFERYDQYVFTGIAAVAVLTWLVARYRRRTPDA